MKASLEPADATVRLNFLPERLRIGASASDFECGDWAGGQFSADGTLFMALFLRRAWASFRARTRFGQWYVVLAPFGELDL